MSALPAVTVFVFLDALLLFFPDEPNVLLHPEDGLLPLPWPLFSGVAVASAGLMVAVGAGVAVVSEDGIGWAGVCSGVGVGFAESSVRTS